MTCKGYLEQRNTGTVENADAVIGTHTGDILGLSQNTPCNRYSDAKMLLLENKKDAM